MDSTTAPAAPQFPFAREKKSYHPSPLNASLRHDNPIAQVELFDQKSAWLLTRHEDCRVALSSDDLSADRRVLGFPEIHKGGRRAKDVEVPTFPNLDGAAHERQRAILEPEFTAHAVGRKWRPMMEEIIDAVIDRMLEKAESHRPIDLVEEFAAPVPTKIIYQALGIPQADVDRLSSDSEIRNSTSRNAAETANARLQAYISTLVHGRMTHAADSGDDIITRLIDQQRQGARSEDEVSALAFLVLTAGDAALISSISVGVLLLLDHPDQLAGCQRDPTSLAGNVVTEICRYHTASALNSRRAVRSDLEIGGQHFHAGEGVICAVQAADRDELKFGADAEEFNILRETDFGDVLGFGFGVHRCQADKFSKTQLEIALVKLFQRCPRWRLADGGEVELTPERMNAGVTRMMVFVD